MASTGRDIAQYIATLNDSGSLNQEEGFLYGDGRHGVEGTMVCWMATVPAIEYAVERQCNLIISHEALTFYDYPVWTQSPPVGPWPSDRERLRLLADHGISVLRVHSTIDPTFIGPALWRDMQFPEPAFHKGCFAHHVVEPLTVTELATCAARATGMDHVRVSGEPTRVVTDVGLAWGGLGLDRHIKGWVAHLLPRGVEALVVGETSDFAQRFAIENGIALIETCHSASEDPGLRDFADHLRAQYPDIPVSFRPQEVPWVVM
jgi:putative NIF3 family GTP cyclohydrolase 1 type 2